MSYEPCDERVARRIREWVDAAGHGSQTRLAAAIPSKFGEPKTVAWLNDIIHNRSDLSLRDLDAVAEAIDVPPGELVRRPDRNYVELTMTELKLVERYRSWPETIRHAVVTWLDYVFRVQDQPPGASAPKSAQRRRVKVQPFKRKFRA